MKQIFFSLLAVYTLTSTNLKAQTGIGTTTPAASAALDITSTSGGVLLPRMSAVQRAAIINPADGLIVYDQDSACLMIARFGSWERATDGKNWNLKGNAGTSETYYLGTLHQPLRFISQGANAGIIDTATGNVGIGSNALSSILTGQVNTALGKNALASNTHGNYNIAVGTAALTANTTGIHNVAVGAASLMKNTTGMNNTSVGSFSMRSNTTGTANTALGSSALDSNTTGYSNTAIGTAALAGNTTGSGNTAMGYGSLDSSTTGVGNTATGYYSMVASKTGHFNTANGVLSLLSNTTGSYNTGIGSLSLSANTTGNKNTAVGDSALVANTTGSRNTAIGDSALNSNVLGNLNTAIGHNANVNTGNLTNATAIGANALVSQSNSLVLGNNANVGIGTSSPSAKLHVAGTVRIVDGNQGNNKVLTSDANGNASWQTLSAGSSQWATSGNDIYNSNTGMVLVGTNTPITSGVLEVVKNSPNGRVASFYNNGAAYMSVLNATENGSSGNPAGCDVCVGSKAINAVSTYGDALFARSTNGRGIYLKGGSSSMYPAMLVETNTGATTALELMGKIKIADGSQGANKVLTSDASGNATWQTAGGGSLDAAYDFGGAGLGRTITADNGALKVVGNDGLLVTGNYGSGASIEASGAGTRMFFNPKKAAFRSGNVTLAQWDDANVGNYSVAMGFNNTASGFYATSFGANNTASASTSAAFGSGTTASDMGATAFGEGSIASGQYAFATGGFTTASGYKSAAIGVSVQAPSYGETSVGIANTSYVPQSISSWAATDRLFTVGNGTGMGATPFSDAMVILKNGNTGWGTSTPTTKMEIKSASTITNAQLLLNENTIGYSRLMFKNTTANTWTMAALGHATHSSSEFNIYYSGTGLNMLSINGVGNAILAGTLTQSSDKRLKRNIQPLQNSLEKLLQLNGYNYQWKKDLNKGDAMQIGFIAQEVEALFPELVTTDSKGMKSVAYQNLVPVLVEAIKELKKENATLKTNNTELSERTASIEEKLATIEAMLLKNKSAALLSKD